MRRLSCALALGAMVGWSIPSRADPADLARGHYARGLEFVSGNDCTSALREFNQAYVISPHFAVLYNIGECLVQLGTWRDAVEVLTRYLQDGRYLVPDGRRHAVAAQIEQLEARIRGAPPETAAPGAAAEQKARDQSVAEADSAAAAAIAAGQAAARAARAARAAALVAEAAARAVATSRSKSGRASPATPEQPTRRSRAPGR